MHRTRLAAGLLGMLLLAGVSRPSSAESAYRGRPLVEVLQELEQRGLELIYSSAVVNPRLSVTVEPSSSDPRTLLDEILEPHGLAAQDGPGGSILILPRGGNTGVVRGRVLSAGLGSGVAGASVHIREVDRHATTGPAGSFEIRDVPAGTYDMTVEARGFLPATIAGIEVQGAADTELNARLQALPEFVTEIVVTPSQHSLARQEQAAQRSIPREVAGLVPSMGGDTSRAVQLLPGVAAADNSAAFHVRGSQTDDVAIILDGLELYDPFHLQSFQSPFSVIDNGVVDRVEFFGGGFTADFGDRHGGFVDISTVLPDGSDQGEVGIGTLNSRVSYRAPHASGSWLVAARAWYPQAVHDTLEMEGGEKLDPRFGDLYAKASFEVAPRVLLSAHSLFSHDRVEFSEGGEEGNESTNALTRNGYLWVRALTAWTPSLTSETVLSSGRVERLRNGVAEPEDEPIRVEDDRILDFWGVRHDTTWQISSAQLLKAGIEIRKLKTEYRYSNLVENDPAASTSIQIDPNGSAVGLYGAYRARLSSDLITEIGLRWDRQTYSGNTQYSPRLNAVWQPGQRSELRLGLGRFSQSQRIHELQIADGETSFSPAEVSEQAELTFQHRLPGGLRLRLDGYYHELSQLRPRYENLFEPIELFPETGTDRVLISATQARLQGAELLVGGDPAQPLVWWVSYGLASADDIVDGQHVPRSWDQKHTGKFLIGNRWGERWLVSLSGTVHTGWPTTPVSAVLLPDGSIDRIEGPRNSDRFPTYARLDLKARRTFSLPRGRMELTLEIVNLTDRDNACCVDDFFYDEQPDGTVDVRRDFDNWVGFTPSFGLLWTF